MITCWLLVIIQFNTSYTMYNLLYYVYVSLYVIVMPCSAKFWQRKILTDTDFSNVRWKKFWRMVICLLLWTCKRYNVLKIWQVNFWQSGWRASNTSKFCVYGNCFMNFIKWLHYIRACCFFSCNICISNGISVLVISCTI